MPKRAAALIALTPACPEFADAHCGRLDSWLPGTICIFLAVYVFFTFDAAELERRLQAQAQAVREVKAAKKAGTADKAAVDAAVAVAIAGARIGSTGNLTPKA